MVRVDLHLHSDVSDGYYGPATVADKAWAAGVRYAALCDHQRIDGGPAFKAVFERHGGVAIPGVELQAVFGGREMHLLAHGFDPGHAAFAALLRETAPAGDLIRSAHEAGGIVSLAHPYVLSRDPAVLDEIVSGLKAEGLDGIEVVYAPYDEEERRQLLKVADRHDLLVTAGSDFHGPAFPQSPAPGVEIETRRWKKFRDALPAFRGRSSGADTRPSAARSGRWFLLHILLPALLTILLFVAGIFGAVIPTLEEQLLNRKREMIRELTNSAWSILAGYEEDERAGRLSGGEARERAREEIRRLRYGPEGKDYFWITDTVPRMVMHPYREDLNGKDLSDFTDPRGVRLFVEFARVVGEKEHGYVDYVWQWKDDPERLAPKESYVRGFRPWGWIIGTGLYIEDVDREIAAMIRRLVDLSAAITLLIGGVIAYLIQQSYRLERRRRRMESDLRASHDRYHLLVEASTEGILMVIEDRCAYANRPLLALAGYSPAELPFLDLPDLFPGEASAPGGPLAADEAPSRFEAALKRKDGARVPVLVSPTRIEMTGRKGWILVLHDGDRGVPARGADGDPRAALISAESPVTRNLPRLVSDLVEAGMPPRRVSAIVTSVSDEVTGRLLELIVRDLGEPPVPFAFLVFGSEGREERTLVTDQDNGILHADVEGELAARSAAYFAAMGERICDDLNRAGYAYCRGESMSRHAKWRGPMKQWKAHFSRWILEPNPEELLQFNIFFDFRSLQGNAELAAELRRHIGEVMAGSPPFFFHLAANALKYRLPLDLFGRMSPPDDSGTIDLKETLLPVVNFARLYALSHRIEATNTLDRIIALRDAGVIDGSTAGELQRTYDLFMRLRYRNQARARAEKREPDNRIDPGRLAPEESAALRQALSSIDIIQKKIGFDYPGAG